MHTSKMSYGAAYLGFAFGTLITLVVTFNIDYVCLYEEYINGWCQRNMFFIEFVHATRMQTFMSAVIAWMLVAVRTFHPHDNVEAGLIAALLSSILSMAAANMSQLLSLTLAACAVGIMRVLGHVFIDYIFKHEEKPKTKAE